MADLTSLEELVLSVLRAQRVPLGARAIGRELSVEGLQTSESTINRLLVDLDARGLTEPIEKKGRVLTAEGKRVSEVLLLSQHRDLYFERALDLQSVDDLIDHLMTRRGIEREAARAAALRASDEEIRSLHALAQPGSVPLHERLAFHRAVGDASHNKQIQAIANTLFVERLEPVESVVLTIGMRQGVLVDWENDHRAIADRIADRDPDGAENEMVLHLDATIRETEAFARSGWSELIREQLLEASARSEAMNA
jgi:GntR family transcriptional repressor for pyruvate dehydrogenase complex